MPTPEKANSLMFVLATITAPAAFRFATARASAWAGAASAATAEPARVGSPRTAKRSLMVIGTPARGGRSAPAARIRSTWRAVSSAVSR